MEYKIIEFDKLSESRELLEAKTPPFMTYFIYLVLIIFLGTFIWAWYGKVDIVVKANGVVRPKTNVSNVINVQGGEVKKINFKDGDFVRKDAILYELDTSASEYKESYLIKEKRQLQNDIYGLNSLYQAVNNNSKRFVNNADIEYLNRYQNYKMQLKELKLNYKQTKRNYEREKELGKKYTTQVKLDKLKNQYEKAKIAKQKYKTEYLLKIKQELNNKRNKLSSINNQMQSVNIKAKHSIIKAPISGEIQVLRNFNEGEFLPSGAKVLKIIPEGQANLKVEIKINNKDISKIKKGQKLKYKFLTYDYSDYGVLDGKVYKISQDAFLTKKQAFYRAYGSLNNTVIKNKKNQIVGKIKPGMICEVSFIQKRQKILFVVLEKLKFWEEGPKTR